MKTLIRLLSVFILFYLCYSCKNQNEKDELEMYIMPKQISANEDGRMEYYLPYNFIFDTGSHIYFYQREPYFTRCGYVDWWQEIRIPPYIDLQPKDIIEIPAPNLEEFVKKNILPVESFNRQVIVCSPYDTVFSEGLLRLITILKDTANHIKWKARKTTQEENIVLDYKKRPYLYFSKYDMKWDSTKTLFFEVLERIIKDERETELVKYEEKTSITFPIDSFINLPIRSMDSVRFRKLAAALKLKVEDIYMLENGD